MPISLNRLNSRQREAVLHTDGPLLVLAGAGSGKTSTMAYRIAHLISARHVPGTAILGLSFTNKAAGELKERVTKLLQENREGSAGRQLTVSTFHSLGVRILRQYGFKLGFRKDFTILDDGDQRDILNQVMRNIRIDERRFDLDVLKFEIGQAKGRFMKPQAAEAFFLESGRVSSDYGIAAASCYPHYQQQLKALNAMDFDDLLMNTVTLLEEHADVREHYNARFRYILVDEYQDTNPAQFRLLRLLTERQQNICVVGDDDQSIYAWRGADPSHILGFAKHYPGARTITLDQNYRSTNTILRAANAVISNNRNRHPKSLWSDKGEGEPISEVILEEDREEAKFVAEEIERMGRELNRKWADFAILYRSNAQSRVFEEALRSLRVPYKIVGGMSFLDRREVKNVLSYWKLVLNFSDDASARRIVNWPARGIGRTSLEMVGDCAFKENLSVFDALERVPGLTPKAQTAARAFCSLIRGLRKDLEAAPATVEGAVAWARASLEKIGAKTAVEEDCDEPAQAARAWDNVEELIHALGQVRPEDLPESAEGASPDEAPPETADAGAVAQLREFIARMTLDASNEDKDEETDNQQKDQVTLLTLHGAKGLEYPIVFLVGLEDGFLPHRRTLDAPGTTLEDLAEERRLCYVGITRAKERLLMTRAKNRIRYGKPVPRNRSRFAEEIPAEMLVLRDESHSPDLSSKDAREKHEEKVKNYLAEIRARIGAKP